MDPALPTVVRRPPPSLSPTRRGARGGSVACRARLAPDKPTVASARHNGPRLPRHRQYPGSSPPPRRGGAEERGKGWRKGEGGGGRKGEGGREEGGGGGGKAEERGGVGGGGGGTKGKRGGRSCCQLTVCWEEGKEEGEEQGRA